VKPHRGSLYVLVFVCREIASHFAAAEEVLNTVPKSMWLGMVRVDCSVVIDFDVAV
jgi:hypothetical protein